ncbi:MAG: DUF2786 domain-containing protein [Burkholderia gladioli]
MDRRTALEKIRKCLALSRSSEAHEAAAALRQAQKLMAQFGVDHSERLAVDASETWSKSRSTSRPVRYEVALANVVADAYGCDLIFRRQLNESGLNVVGGYAFIGIAPSPEIAQYTFDVFALQLRAARRAYIEAKLRRCGPRNKTARADEFCEGWVWAVRRQLQETIRTDEQNAVISAYMRLHHSRLQQFDPRARTVSGRPAADDLGCGIAQGRNAVVRPGVGAAKVRRLPRV